MHVYLECVHPAVKICLDRLKNIEAPLMVWLSNALSRCYLDLSCNVSKSLLWSWLHSACEGKVTVLILSATVALH